jgi:septal ring factor EnvC (AmiA/AmiB activator)
MKKLLGVLVLVLAVNFLAVAGGVGWLFASGAADKAKVAAVRDLLWPKPPVAEAVATQPSTQPAVKATDLLDDLLAKYAGRRAGEQVELIQQSVDAQGASLDRRARELDNLLAQILREKEELTRKSGALEAERKRVAAQEDEQKALAGEKGFQDSLKLYSSMSGKQAKASFLAMSDDMVVRYLQSMPQRTAAKIIKEFKSPDEQDRINRVLERMRQGNPATQPAAGESAASGRAAKVPPDPFAAADGPGPPPTDGRPPTE